MQTRINPWWKLYHSFAVIEGIAAPDKIASIRRLQRPLTLDEIAAEIREVDIILTEGFKRGGKPALEVVRRENGLELVGAPPQLLAVAADAPLEAAVPPEILRFELEDAPSIVDWIEHTFLGHR